MIKKLYKYLMVYLKLKIKNLLMLENNKLINLYYMNKLVLIIYLI